MKLSIQYILSDQFAVQGILQLAGACAGSGKVNCRVFFLDQLLWITLFLIFLLLLLLLLLGYLCSHAMLHW